jgi:hypothetical protein
MTVKCLLTGGPGGHGNGNVTVTDLLLAEIRVEAPDAKAVDVYRLERRVATSTYLYAFDRRES